MNPNSTGRLPRRRPTLSYLALIGLVIVTLWITVPSTLAALGSGNPADTAVPPTDAGASLAADTPALTPTPFLFPTPVPTSTPLGVQVPSPSPSPSPTPLPSPTATPAPTAAPIPIPPLPKPTITKGSPTRISLEVPTGSVIGKDVVVVAILRDRVGGRIPNEHLSLFVDGIQIRSDRTDAHGQISFTILGKRLDQARGYQLGVLFGGSHGWAGSTVVATMTILNAAIQIVTVPPLPGLRFALGLVSGVTGPDGVAALPVPQSGSYQLTTDLNSDTVDPSIKASFVRWLDNVFTANRTIDVTGAATYTIGLRVAYRATIKYVDLNNQPVDPALIEQAQFSTGTGTDDVVLNQQTGAGDVWWTASTTIRASSQLVASPITYRVLSVKIHGAEVVNRGQQSWTPTDDGVWTIQVLLYGLTVQTRDALFGTPVEGRLQLTYPDGFVDTATVGSDGTATFNNLPRGQYQLKLASSSLTPPTPVALSKPQSAVLRVITLTDIGSAAGLLIAVAFVLALIGRWSVLRSRGRRRSASRAAGPSAT